MKKKYLFGWIYLVPVCALFANNFVFAASSCQTCFDSPKQLSTYVSAMQSVVSQVASVKAKNGAYEQKIVSGIKVYSDLLVGIPRDFIGQDLLANFKIIFNGYPAVRDWKKVLNLDQYIGDAVRQVSSNGMFDETISDTDMNRFNNYLTQIKFMKNFKVQNGATYGELVSVLWQVHKLYKEAFLAVSYTNTSKDYNLEDYMAKAFKGYEKKFSTDTDYPSIDSNYVDDLKKSYECSLGPGAGKETGCSTQLDKFIKDMEHIIDTVKDADKIFEKFSDSRKKLQNALKGIGSSGFKGEYLQRHVIFKKQIELGPVQELLDASKSSGMWSMGKLVQKGEDLKDSLRKNKESSADEFAGETKDWDNSGSKKTDEPNTQDLLQKKSRENFAQNMQDSFKAVLSEGQDMANNIPMETPDPSPTMNFPNLSKKVYAAKKQLKDIKENFSQACEKQCQNVDADCGGN